MLGAPVLAGLFGLAVALGTLGRAWSGPAAALSHLDCLGHRRVRRGRIGVRQQPARRVPAGGAATGHPFALLVGLNLGPNLFVTGSLAWLLWLRAARAAGARPSVATAARLGALAVPLAMAAALGASALTGPI